MLAVRQPSCPVQCSSAADSYTHVRARIVRPVLMALLLTLVACAGNYQAPVDDRSSNLERTAPLIVVNGQAQSSPSAVSAQSQAPVVSAAGSASQVGSATTVVRPVAVGSGISRSVTRNQMPAADTAPAPSPVQSGNTNRPAPASQTPVPQTSTAAPTAAPAAAGAAYAVRQGDTLYSIAFANNIDVRTLALANNLAPPYTIFPGQRLNLIASGVSAAALDAVPQIPAAPAGEATPATGQRPQAAIDARRTGSVATRTVEGVSWQWPAEGRLLSTFSESGSARGIDIAGTHGQPVFAAADGDVVYAGSGIQGAGNLLILRHNQSHLSAYMYNSAMLVAEGDQVRAGDKIAEIGTGPSGRDLLHFEVRVNGNPVDPVRYLPNR